MRKFLKITAGLIVAMLLFQNCQKSEFIVITGVVRDSITNEPIEGVFIRTSIGNAITSNSGTFSLNVTKSGKISLHAVEFKRYFENSKEVIIREGVNKVDIKLAPIILPKINTGRVYNVDLNSATIKGNLNFGSLDDIIEEYGHCWTSSSAILPTIDNNIGRTVFSGGFDKVPIISIISNLDIDKTYYVRAYARSTSGKVYYGNILSFKTNSVNIVDGLLAYFPLNNSFYDISGNGYYLGGYTGYFTRDRFNVNNYASNFNYNYQYFWSYDQEFLEIEDFSISFWYKASYWQNNAPLINLGYSSYYQNYINIFEENANNQLSFGIKTASGSEYKVSAPVPSIDKWHHVVAQRSNRTIQLYIDGDLVANGDCDDQIINNNLQGWGYGYFFAGFFIDPNNSWNWYYYQGALDEIRMYNKPLSLEDIEYLSKN